MSTEFPITGMPSVGSALQSISKKLRVSVSALCEIGGVSNGSLTGIATGNSQQKDMTLGPLLRVLRSTNYELTGRTVNPNGIILKPEGATEVLITGADGGRLEVCMQHQEDIPVLINTMAFANGLSVTGLIKLTGVSSTSLVQLAHGTGTNTDARLSNVLRLVQAAGFEMIVRPCHPSRRAARMALLAGRRD